MAGKRLVVKLLAVSSDLLGLEDVVAGPFKVSAAARLDVIQVRQNREEAVLARPIVAFDAPF